VNLLGNWPQLNEREGASKERPDISTIKGEGGTGCHNQACPFQGHGANYGLKQTCQNNTQKRHVLAITKPGRMAFAHGDSR